MPGTASPPPDPATDSRLLPADRRTPLQAAPTTSSVWRVLVLGRGWLNLHRHRWLAPALVCAPPVGVALLWAGASRPGHHRRWLTVGAVAWTLALLGVVLLLTVPGAQPATADGVPAARAGAGSATGTSSGSAAEQASAAADRAAAAVGDAAVASSAAEVRGAPVREAGVGGAAVVPSQDQPTGDDGGASSVPRAASTPVAAAPPVTRPVTTTPPGPSRTPVPARTATPKPPAVARADPFSVCAREGTLAVAPNGWSLKCYRTPIGLYWLYGQ